MQSYSDFVREKNKKQSDSEANKNKVQSYSDFIREKNEKQTNSKPVNESEIKDKIKPGNPIHTLPAPLQIAEKMRTSAISSIDTALKQPVVSALHKSAKTEQMRRNALQNNKDDDKDVEFGFTWFDDNGLVVEGTKEQAQKRLTRKQEIKNEYNYLDDDVMADLRIMAEGLNAEPMTKGLTGVQVAMFGGEEYGNYTQRIADAEKARKRLKDKGYSSLQVDTWAKMQQEGINQQYAADLQQGFDEMAKEHPALSSFASVGVKLATTPLDAATKIDEAVSGNINTNGIVDIASQTDDMIRSSVAKDIEEESEIGAWLYNVGMSGVDSAVASVMPGGFLFLATDAATSTMRDLTNRGLSTEQAFFGGVAAGVFEALFERVSIGNFKALQEVSPLGVKDVVKNVLKSTGVNFTEEAATELANILYDTIAHGDLSQLKMLAEKYDGDYAKAFGELALQVGEAGLSGAVMGSGFGVTGSAIGYASNYGDIKTTGKQVKAEGIADLILEQGKSAPQKSRPNQAYQHAQKKLDKGKGLSDRDIGLVAYENLQYAQENAPELNGVFESAESLQDVEALYNAERYRLNYQVPISKEQTNALKALEADYKTAKSSLENYNKSGARAMFDSSLRENTFTETDTVKTKMPDIGKTKEGEVVSVSSIENIEDGKITVKTSEGTTQALDIKKDIKSVDAQTLWTNATKNFTDAASAQAYIENYDGGSIADYTKAFNDYYNLAATGLTLERINEQEIAPYYDLSEQAQAAAVEMGRKSMAFKKGVVDLTVRPKTKAQQLQMNMLDAIGKHTGLNFVVVENMKDEGFYKTGSNQVVLSLGSSKGLVLRTAGHETYHYVQTTLSDRAKDIETFVLDTLKNNKGEKWVNDRLKYYEKLGYEGKQKQTDELVADSLFDVFTNKRAVEQFAIKDQSLAQKISNHIKQLIADIKNIINKVIASGDYSEITAWQEDLASLEKLNNMFLDVLDELAMNQELQKATETVEDNGYFVDESGAIQMSIRHETDMDGQITSEELAQKMSTVNGLSFKENLKYIKDTKSISARYYRDVFEGEGLLDYEYDDNYDVIKSNSDYSQGSIDFNTNCPKRRDLTEIYDTLQQKYPDHIFTADELAYLRQIIAEEGLEVACGCCFVEDRRQKLGEIAQEYIRMYNEALKSESGQLVKRGTKGKQIPMYVTNTIAEMFGDTLDVVQGEPLIITDKYVPTQYDLGTYEGFSKLRKEHPQIAMGYIAYNNSRGQQAGRLIEGVAEYKRQLLNWSQQRVDKANSVGGLRIFSFSDFTAVHALDMIQIIQDASAIGLKVQGYTKINAFARMIKDTGIKLNRSLIPTATGIKIVDGKKVLAFNIRDGIDPNSKDFFDSSDNPNVGNILIGINEEQIRLAMESDLVDYIIPFHSNQARRLLEWKNVPKEWKNYKKFQLEKDASTGKNTRNSVNIYTDVIDKYGIKTEREFTESFLAECKERNLIPRFAEFLNKDSNGNYVYTEGYYKLLLDFKLFDKNGNILPQNVVQPKFDADFINEMLDDYVKGEATRKSNSTKRDAVVDRFSKAIESGELKQVVAQNIADWRAKKSVQPAVFTNPMFETVKKSVNGDAVFSLNRSVEETKDLVAVHNITEQQLFDVLQRGKLIAPSLAVTNLGHTGFADISLVFNKETIDPLSSKENKLFGADAWTPTQTTLKKGARFDGNKVSKTISDIKSLIGSRYVGELFDVNVKQFEEAIRKADGSVYSAYSENIGMQTAYALEKGFVSKLPTTRGMLDKTALKEQLDTVLHADKNWRAYKLWLNDISDSVIKGFNTATNEDILNNMKAQPVSAKPFKLTESGELFVPAAEYAGIEDMRQNKHRLSKSAEAETKKVATKLMSFANRLGKAKGVDSKTVIKAINNSFENRYNTKDIAKSFGLNGIEISNSIARDLQALYKEAVELPTPYFEAKPLRDVGVSEVAMAILPDTSSNELKTLLKENGIPYQEYENGNDDSRIKALNSVDEVKFSRNRDSSISEEASDYILDTKEYQEILDIVDQRFEATGRKELSPKAIDRLAGKLLTKSKSNYSRERLTERLTALFDYIANSRDLEWSEVTSIAAEISKDVLKESQTLDRSMQMEYADVLKLMRESKVYISPEVKQEIAYSFGSYESFKRMLGNKLKVTVTDASAVPLDVFWRELSENRPEMFDADTNYLDMPSAIVDFFEMTSPQYINPYDIEMDMDEAAYDFALQIYDEYFNIPEVISEAKKHQYEIERLKGKYNAKINELHNTYRERIKKLRKEKNNKIEATKALYRQRHEAYREKRNETQNKQKLRSSIYRTSKALVDKLVNPTDQKHIPQELISSVNEFAKAITESGVFTPDRAMRLKKAFKAIGENGTDADANLSTMYNEEFAEMFEELQDTIAGRRLTELNSSELETVRDTIKYVAHVVSMSNRAFSDGIKERLGVLQNDALEEFSKQNPDRKRVKFEIQKGLLKPVTFFELIESPTMMKLYQNVRQGEGKWYNTIASAKKRRQDAADKFNYKSWKKDTITIKPERFGGNVVLSIDEALSIYATANRQQGVDHLLLGGIVREEDAKKKLDRKKKTESVDVRSDNIPLTIKDISEITSKLTKEQRGYADSLVEYMSNDMASLGNEVSMRLFGIKKFNEQKYFPLKSASNFLFSKPAVESDARIKHMSMTKPTTPKANNPVVIGNFTETVMNHCNDMALYYSFCLPLEDFNRVYNFKTQPTTLERPTSIKQKIDAAFGSKANSYIKQLLTDINGGVTQQAGTGFVNKMIAKAKKNAVFGSLSVAVQQPSAIARAFLYVDPKYFVSSTFNRRDWDELKKYAPVAGVKEMGYFDTNVGKQAVDWMSEDGYDGLKEKAFALFKDKDYRDDKLSFLPSYMDRITWGHIWNAVKKETAHNNPNMDVKSEEFLTLAGKRFTFVIDRTQVYDSVFARSEWMRSKDTGVKVATAFMSEPLTNYNMLYSAAVKARHGDVKFGAKALSAYLVSVAFNSLLKALVTAGRDDDEDKSYWEKYLSHVVGNFVDEPFGMIPYLKDFVSLLQGYDSKRMDTQALADIADAVMTVFNEDKSGWEKFKSAFGAVGIAAGIPFKNLVRDGEMIYRGVKDIYDGKKQPTTEKGIEYAIKEELGFDVPTKYDQLVEAYLEGDYAHYKKVDNNLKASTSDKAISSGIKTAVKGKYQSGTITDNQAIDILEEMLGLEEDDAYWQIQEWDNADNEDWSKYSNFYSAIDSNKNLQATIKTYTDNGVTTKTLSSRITGHYKEQYIELYKTDRVAASKLKSKLVEVYALLGYKRADKSKDIDAWLKPQK